MKLGAVGTSALQLARSFGAGDLARYADREPGAGKNVWERQGDRLAKDDLR